VKKTIPQPLAARFLSVEPFSPLPPPTPREVMRQFLDPTRGVLLIDRERRIRSVNRAFEAALGLPQGLSIGKCLGDVLLCCHATSSKSGCGTMPECLSCGAREMALAALTQGETGRGLSRFRVQAGGESREVELRMCATPLELNGQELAVVVVEDLSPLRRIDRVEAGSTFHDMVGQDAQMLDLFDTARQVGPINVPVLIQGESGTGKEMVARALHQESSRRDRPLIIVNGGALAGGLLESELFGHVKGAFTGATRDKPGRFELAHRGTMFLDEVGELSLEMQVKLLRVLQNGTFYRVGGEATISVDTRVICATSRDLQREVEAGCFRLDLFYRLCVVLVNLPSLRRRAGDIPLLAEHLLSLAAFDFDLPPPKLTPPALTAMVAYRWPGNVRELDNAMRHALIKSGGGSITPEHLPTAICRGEPPLGSLVVGNQPDLTPEKIAEVLQAVKGNKSEAARRLGISRATLYRRLARQKWEGGP
jgi:DNA-binding NtrC family response regulator